MRDAGKSLPAYVTGKYFAGRCPSPARGCYHDARTNVRPQIRMQGNGAGGEFGPGLSHERAVFDASRCSEPGTLESVLSGNLDRPVSRDVPGAVFGSVKS